MKILVKRKNSQQNCYFNCFPGFISISENIGIYCLIFNFIINNYVFGSIF